MTPYDWSADPDRSALEHVEPQRGRPSGESVVPAAERPLHRDAAEGVIPPTGPRLDGPPDVGETASTTRPGQQPPDALADAPLVTEPPVVTPTLVVPVASSPDVESVRAALADHPARGAHAAPARAPYYERLLDLQHIHLRTWQRALFAEGSIFVAVFLALADVASAWLIPLLPITVGLIVKGHDVLAGWLERWARR
jgi:hypothetical protein